MQVTFKTEWLLRVPEIRAELAAIETPVVDRSMVEQLFRLKRRRSIELMHSFGGFQSGRTFLIDRLQLLRQLEEIEAAPEFERARRRRERQRLRELPSDGGRSGLIEAVLSQPRRGRR